MSYDYGREKLSAGLCTKCRCEPVANGGQVWGRKCLNAYNRERAKTKKEYNPTPAEILAFHKPWGSYAVMKPRLEPIP